jgi:hypothetical protein
MLSIGEEISCRLRNISYEHDLRARRPQLFIRQNLCKQIFYISTYDEQHSVHASQTGPLATCDETIHRLRSLTTTQEAPSLCITSFNYQIDYTAPGAPPSFPYSRLTRLILVSIKDPTTKRTQFSEP